MTKPTLLLTAVSAFLTSEEGLAAGTLARALRSYGGLSLSIIVAVPKGREKTVTKSLEAHSHPGADFLVVGVSERSKGSLASAMAALSASKCDDGELIIAAGDTEFLNSEPIAAIQRLFDGGTEMGTIVFQSKDPRFSYLNMSWSGRVNYVLEKKVVGKFATTGVFYFRSAKSFLEAAKWCFVNNATFEGNFYVSAALNYALYLGGNVAWCEIEESHFCKSFE